MRRKMVTILDELYRKVLYGVPKVSKPVDELANDYLEKNILLIFCFFRYILMKGYLRFFVMKNGGFLFHRK